MPSRGRFHDDEFSPDVLKVLQERDLLGDANAALLVPLVYNLKTLAAGMESQFQQERIQNSLLETTAPEVWIAGKLVPKIQEVRSNADVDERILVVAVRRYLTCGTAPQSIEIGEQHLCKTIEPFVPKIERLLLAITDRRRRLRDILHLGVDAYTVRGARKRPEARSRVQDVFARGIEESWSNQRIARELDLGGARPRNSDFPSYSQMLRMRAQLFYSLKNSIKRKLEL